MFELERDWFRDLPAEPALARILEAGLEIWPDISEGEMIGLGWTLLVSDREDELLELAPEIPGFRWAAVGILDADVDRALEIGPRDDGRRQRFGVIFYAEDAFAESAVVGATEVAGVELPIVLRPISYEEHAPPPTLPDGTIACWATSAGGEREGWLTARHVAVGGGYPLVDCGRECIDAALIETGQIGGGRPARAVVPSAGATIEMIGPHMRRMEILDVALNLRIKRSSFFPLRFTTSAPGRPGDSGSLLLANPCGEPVGIYLGAAQLEGGQREAGIGLAITQLEDLMKMEVYL